MKCEDPELWPHFTPTFTATKKILGWRLSWASRGDPDSDRDRLFFYSKQSLPADIKILTLCTFHTLSLVISLLLPVSSSSLPSARSALLLLQIDMWGGSGGSPGPEDLEESHNAGVESCCQPQVELLQMPQQQILCWPKYFDTSCKSFNWGKL